MKRTLVALLLSCIAPLAGAGEPAPAEVAVLSTLHQLHAQVPAYSNEVLRESILRLRPDVLCMEVREDQLAARAPERAKVEYPQVVYPLLDEQGYATCALEPAQPLYDQIGRAYMQAAQAHAEANPEAAAAFSAQAEAMYALLRVYWTDAARVNDAVTDAQMRAKHAIQTALRGEGERAGWEGWNEQFLAGIRRAVAAHPGQRIVVLAGAEHGYWLRERLANEPGVRLLDTAALLAD